MKELGRKTERKDKVSERGGRGDMRERRDRKGDRPRRREYEAGRSGRTWGGRREKDYRYSE